MTVKMQKPIKFINDCNCIVDYKELEKAILWYQDAPTNSIKHIYLHNTYPTISIKKEKKFIHRILIMYKINKKFKRPYVVHHKDNNRLNNVIDNLELMTDAQHQSLHAKGRPLTQTQRDAIIKSNKKRNLKRDKLGRYTKFYEGVNNNE